MRDQDNLVDALTAGYIYHKERLVKDAGSSRKLDVERMQTLMRPRMEAMARLVRDWDIEPDMLMDAAFAWARRNRHPDGPLPTMFLSVKYLTKAVSNYLQIPYEAVMESRGVALFLERSDYEYTRSRNELRDAGVSDLVTATSYPVELRYVMAVEKLDMTTAFYLAEELLRVMAEDRRVRLWMEHRGCKYELVAAHFNKTKGKTQ